MNVQWPVFRRQTKNQTTRTILVILIILDDFAGANRGAQFLNANPTQKALVNSVFRKLEKSGGNLSANLVKHQQSIILCFRCISTTLQLKKLSNDTIDGRNGNSGIHARTAVARSSIESGRQRCQNLSHNRTAFSTACKFWQVCVCTWRALP